MSSHWITVADVAPLMRVTVGRGGYVWEVEGVQKFTDLVRIGRDAGWAHITRVVDVSELRAIA